MSMSHIKVSYWTVLYRSHLTETKYQRSQLTMKSSSDISRIGLASAIFYICLLRDLVRAEPMIHLSVHLQTELFDRCSRAEEPTSDMLRHQLGKIQHHPDRQCLRRVSLISDLHLHDVQPSFLRNCPTSRSDQEASEEFRARVEAPW